MATTGELDLARGTPLTLGLRTYSVHSMLGQGANGKVYCLVSTSARPLALKLFYDAREAEHERRMYSIAGTAPGIQQLIGSVYLYGHGTALLFAPMHGSLAKWMDEHWTTKACPPRGPLMRWIGRQLLTGLVSLHRQHVLHGDLKPANVLVKYDAPSSSSNRLLLADLSAAYTVLPGTAICGEVLTTRYYRSPAQLLGLPFGLDDDLWALACVLYECQTGHVLLAGHSDEHQLQLVLQLLGPPPGTLLQAMPASKREQLFVRRGTAHRARWVLREPLAACRRQLPEDMDGDLHEVLTQLLRYEGRPSAEQLMAHPFFRAPRPPCHAAE